jgi:hydrogenase expression/formation protein HypC
MCLGIPGRVIETYSEHDIRMGKVDFGGVYKRVCLEHTPDAQTGQFVIVHVGFALQVIDEQEARTVFEFLERMNELDELRQEEPEGRSRSSMTGLRNPQSAIPNPQSP